MLGSSETLARECGAIEALDEYRKAEEDKKLRNAGFADG